MTPFACWCRDKADTADARAQHHDAHLAHVEAHIDRFLIAGPMLRDGVVVGSLLIVKAEKADDARAFLALDPLFGSGIFESIEVEPFIPAAGDWVGGAIWKK